MYQYEVGRPRCLSLLGMSAALKVEVAVIGAGVIGLACARNFAIRGKEVLILDRAGQIGSGVLLLWNLLLSVTIVLLRTQFRMSIDICHVASHLYWPPS